MAPLVLGRYLSCPWEQFCTALLAKTDINNDSLPFSGASFHSFTGKSLFVLTLYEPILNEIRRDFSGCSISLRSQDKAELQRLPCVPSLKRGSWREAF